jgi:hypothetical protein
MKWLLAKKIRYAAFDSFKIYTQVTLRGASNTVNSGRTELTIKH